MSNADSSFTPPAIPGYRLYYRLGKGGMAEVYLANQLSTRQLVAIKFLQDGIAGTDACRRFQQEAELLASFQHPNIIPVYEAGRVDGVLYFVLKYMRDGALSTRLNEVRVSARRVVEVVAKIVSAVVYSHSRKVIHRDLKPSNVLLDDGNPVVSDFGVAKWAFAAEQTVQGTQIGTAAYMAPEMLARGSSATGPQADIWSVGVILYELLSNSLPFPANTDSALLEMIAISQPIAWPPCCPIVPGTDDRLLTILQTALAMDQSRRYPTAAALEHDLQCWLDDKPIVPFTTEPATPQES